MQTAWESTILVPVIPPLGSIEQTISCSSFKDNVLRIVVDKRYIYTKNVFKEKLLADFYWDGTCTINDYKWCNPQKWKDVQGWDFW